jgi:diguanylate cyclase (GGDEF)-like protein
MELTMPIESAAGVPPRWDPAALRSEFRPGERKIRVLVAEDDPVNRRLLQATLTKWGYDVTVACEGASACEILTGPNPPSLAILDWMMPGKDGNQVCREVRQRPAERYTYILLLTAKSQKDDIIGGLEAGADDYLTKPFDPPELKARLSTGCRILDLQDQLIAARELMRQQALLDSLTGVLNHAAILDNLEREADRARRDKNWLGVILADIDHFKRINDTHGHQAGDAVLLETTRRMAAVIRPYDMIGRYGGEEFLILLPGCDKETSARIAERIRENVGQTPIDVKDKPVPVTISLGVAVREGSSALEPSALIHSADVALYQAKARGRNRVVVAEGNACVAL